ncbi:flavoprotein [Streptomyces sp. Ru71]|uniref:FAD-dependent oxidoreductase n=1 Tax=Streptomyces sp. Ru71 TaxID=2080746 RepID=UPI000CDD6B41|nr:FAD-dependent oxidoreductase [Streptomyces sp. Ru71]POX57213.1 flavoprotein [Streptomyces sp. Ru71]
MRPCAAADVGTWDLTADVVIAGYGVAGAAAAVEAARAGAEVLVLERAGGWGGAAALAGGFIYLGGGTALQRACGFEDSPEDMAAFLTAAMGPGADAAKISAYCEGSVAHFDWLVECGVPFRPVFYGEPAWEPAGDEGLMYSGGENAHPFSEMVRPAPRGHLPRMENKRTGERGGGYMLMKPLVETAERLGVKAHFGLRIEQLVVEGDGRVCGVVARGYGERVTVRARRGVVLATGGFTYNEEMLAAHAPLLVGRPGSAVEEHDGVAVRLAQGLGAGVAHMDACEVAVHMDPQYLIRGIVVNGRGQRFINEDTYPGRIGQAALFQQGDETFLVLDEEGFEEAGRVSAAPEFLQLRPTWVCGSAAELGAEMGLPPGALEATVEVYNRHAEHGRDPLLHKAARWVRPLRGPLGAVDLRGMTSGFALGGLTTGTDAEVLHVSGEPIPGLYAAGRATAGIAAWGYASGASLGDGSFFGRRAGRGAALGR